MTVFNGDGVMVPAVRSVGHLFLHTVQLVKSLLEQVIAESVSPTAILVLDIIHYPILNLFFSNHAR